jgi:hypothetical protein
MRLPVNLGATGPLPDSLTAELQALKNRLAAMGPEHLAGDQTDALRTEIGAIRLHLKRIALEREDVSEMIAEALDRAPDGRSH